MRKAATILTRAACLMAGGGTIPDGSAPRFHTMSGLMKVVRRELYPEHRKKVPAGEPNEAAWAWAFALIPQDPIDKAPTVRELIFAARMLRRMAEMEEQPLPTASEIRAAERELRRLSTRSSDFSREIAISVQPKGYFATALHYDGSRHDLLKEDSLEGLVAAAKEAAEQDPAAKLRAEAAKLGFALVERGAA